MAKTCGMCGISNGDEVEFCGACGSPLAGAPSGARPETADSEVAIAKTIRVGAPGVPGADSGTKKTMLGIAAPFSAAPPPTQAARPGGKPPMAVPQPAPGVRDPGTPMKEAKRTVLGIPSPGSVPRPEAAARPGSEAPAAVPGQAFAGAPNEAFSATAEQETLEEPIHDASREAEANARPEVDAGVPSAIPAAAPHAASAAGRDEEERRESDESVSPRRRGFGAPLAAAGVVAVLLIAGAAYYFFVQRGTTLTPQIFRTGDGEELAVALSFPEAPAGTTVQMNDQAVLVVAGQARLDLAMDQLHLGVNQVPLLYAEPGSPPRQMSFELLLRHVVEPDLSGLAAADPYLTVRFRVAPGMQLHVEGKPALSNGGAYDHRVALADVIPPGGIRGDALIHRVAFELVDSDGNVEEGGYPVDIPVTSLRIDRPADGAVVDFGEVSCSGVTEAGAVVTVDGQQVPVIDDRFATVISLTVVGEYKMGIVAAAPGKAPRTETLTVRRVEDLSGTIAEWARDVDRGLDYPTLGRDPNAHVGKKISIEGRIVNINTERGVTAFLLYVSRGCPAGARCAIYVVYRGEMDAGLQSWVGVHGEVRGTRAVDLPGGSKLHVPAVDAAFVVKSDAPRPGRSGARR